MSHAGCSQVAMPVSNTAKDNKTLPGDLLAATYRRSRYR